MNASSGSGLWPTRISRLVMANTSANKISVIVVHPEENRSPPRRATINFLGRAASLPRNMAHIGPMGRIGHITEQETPILPGRPYHAGHHPRADPTITGEGKGDPPG